MSDFQGWDFLPGFGGTLVRENRTLVLGVGFEPIDIPTLRREYKESNPKVRIVLSFPSNPDAVRREWLTLRKILRLENPATFQEDIVTLSPHDSEAVYHQLETWKRSGERLMMAPFGPKPHTLAMALFSIKESCNIFYTQPRSYNPDYTRGEGDTWAYIVKWDGIPCYDRQQQQI